MTNKDTRLDGVGPLLLPRRELMRMLRALERFNDAVRNSYGDFPGDHSDSGTETMRDTASAHANMQGWIAFRNHHPRNDPMHWAAAALPPPPSVSEEKES